VSHGEQMPSSEYFRKQAEICLKLSLAANSREIATRLVAMAVGYNNKADLDDSHGLESSSAQASSPESQQSQLTD
jgi:hypothetical protein